jgi:dolichol-phosphate mannosyltransferase
MTSKDDSGPLPRFTLVIPVFNEVEDIRGVLAAAVPILEGLAGPWEAIIVDDGSTDGTFEVVEELSRVDRRVRFVRFPGNRGQAVALLTGLRAARGEFILTMDGDGQDDPAEFPALLAEMERTGADLICGWRRDRQDSTARRLMSRLANAVRRRLLHDAVHDSGCQTRVFRRAVVAALFPSRLMQSFVPAMAAGAGFRVAEKVVHHRPRQHGESKYSVRRLAWRPAVEMFRVWRELRRRRRAGVAGGAHASGASVREEPR